MKHLKPSAGVVAEKTEWEAGLASPPGGNDPPVSLSVSGDHMGNMDFHPHPTIRRGCTLGGLQGQMGTYIIDTLGSNKAVPLAPLSLFYQSNIRTMQLKVKV